MNQTRILGTGSYLPPKLLTNHDLEKMVDTSHEWIIERTGISARHMAGDDEQTTDLALKASLNALEAAGLESTDLDGILFATTTPDYIMPNAACVLQDKLGAKNIMALDVYAACTGFVACYGIADQFIKTGALKNILVVGAEKLHTFVNYKDRNTCILFGDGAGAAIVGASQNEQDSKVYTHNLHGEGRLGHLLTQKAGGSKHDINQEMIDNDGQYVTMNGREIFKHAVRAMSNCCKQALEEGGLTLDQVDWIIPHQANARIIEAVAKHLGADMKKVIVEIENMGNTSAATIPYCIDLAVRDGRIKRGDNVLLTAFGGGLTSGALLLKY